jgi:hypothetical protein
MMWERRRGKERGSTEYGEEKAEEDEKWKSSENVTRASMSHRINI